MLWRVSSITPLMELVSEIRRTNQKVAFIPFTGHIILDIIAIILSSVRDIAEGSLALVVVEQFVSRLDFLLLLNHVIKILRYGRGGPSIRTGVYISNGIEAPSTSRSALGAVFGDICVTLPSSNQAGKSQLITYCKSQDRGLRLRPLGLGSSSHFFATEDASASSR